MNAELLEQAVKGLESTGKRPKNLHAAVIDYLTNTGESAVLVDWLMQSHRSEGSVKAPELDKPLISVVIPCYNHAEYLPDCIRSVVSQSFSELEIIVINDGSSDNTESVAKACIDAYPQHRIRYYAQPNSGLVASRNKGITRAKGEFILPLDADDLIAPSFLAQTVPVLMAHAHFGYVSTKALFFGDVNKIWPAQEFNPLSFFFMNQQTCTTLFRKSMWRELHGYRSEMVHGYEDWEFWIRATQQGWAGAQIAEPLFFYRRKKQSMLMDSRSKDVMIKEQIVRLNPAVYDASILPQVQDELTRPNWIPPRLIRENIAIRRRQAAGEEPLNHNGIAAQQEALAERVRKAIAYIVPEIAPYIAQAKPAGAADAFAALARQIIARTHKFFELQSPERAVEMAAILLAQYPLEKLAVTHAMQTLARAGNIAPAHALGGFYLSLWHWDRDILEFFSQLFSIQASIAESPAQKLGLYEGAALFAPHSSRAFGELYAFEVQAGMLSVAERTLCQAMGFSHTLTDLAAPSAPAPCSATRNTARERKHIWYVADGFGASNSGVNGVTQARFMTLASLLYNDDLCDITIITPMDLGLPGAIAEFARHCHALRDKQNPPWPEWIPTVRRNAHSAMGITEQSFMQGEWLPCRLPGSKPDLIIIEGVRRLPHDYLQELGLPFACPTVYMNHNSPFHFAADITDDSSLAAMVDALRNYTVNICVAENVTKEWQAIPELAHNKSLTIHNCIREDEAAEVAAKSAAQTRAKLGLPENAFLIICLASIQVRKGQDILLDAMGAIVAEIPDAQLLLVGPVLPGFGGEGIVQQAQRSPHADRIHILGPRDNALEYLYAADLSVLPSRGEALPLSILEGMVLGTPCVASDVNGIPELVVHGETGYMFPLAQPHMLAEYVIALARDSASLASMAEKGRERYWKHFSREKHVQRWREVLMEIFACHSSDAESHQRDCAQPDAKDFSARLHR
ncbi:glycosyltransferase [Desulfovibrio psychrotolerans]|uniref:Glycosyltransferase 2-like domain-containing protein n=1 Tax=Desulfovibrio psychrotolerans TaxID=415242 RepID=A0A7J0BXV5_9BACT|nr:glycosyltransferase [Desulfovibrio psychrotolerans]GFM38536.1 hypothetical protein DSM19430T_32200 [Desulfovibrio psychrotolerans]